MLARTSLRFCISINKPLQAEKGASYLKSFIFSTIWFLSKRFIYDLPYCSLSRCSNCSRIGESFSSSKLQILDWGSVSQNSILLSFNCKGLNSGSVNKPFKIFSVSIICLLFLKGSIYSLLLYCRENSKLWQFGVMCLSFSSLLLVGSS